jgi:hypothetical protein
MQQRAWSMGQRDELRQGKDILRWKNAVIPACRESSCFSIVLIKTIKIDSGQAGMTAKAGLSDFYEIITAG